MGWRECDLLCTLEQLEIQLFAQPAEQVHAVQHFLFTGKSSTRTAQLKWMWKVHGENSIFRISIVFSFLAKRSSLTKCVLWREMRRMMGKRDRMMEITVESERRRKKSVIAHTTKWIGIMTEAQTNSVVEQKSGKDGEDMSQCRAVETRDDDCITLFFLCNFAVAQRIILTF